MWDILLRGQQGFSFSFIEEMWSRNLPNILMSPLRPAEFVLSLILMSLIRLALGVVPVTVWGQFADSTPIVGGVDRATVVARVFTALYFAFFLLMPWYTRIDKTQPEPTRVTM